VDLVNSVAVPVRPGGTNVRVQRLVMPATGAESCTVLDEGLVTVEAAERFLAQLSAI
jgi:hypothetical protein